MRLSRFVVLALQQCKQATVRWTAELVMTAGMGEEGTRQARKCNHWMRPCTQHWVHIGCKRIVSVFFGFIKSKMSYNSTYVAQLNLLTSLAFLVG